MSGPDRHAESRNVLESILRKIPGFRGYLEKEYRRESDHLARMWLADELQKCKSRLDDWQRSMLDAGQIDLLASCERLRGRIDGLQSRVKGAMRGYSGFFDYVRVDEAMLDQIYQLDRELVDEASSLLHAAESLPSAEGTPDDRLRRIGERVEELSRRFDHRSQLLKGLNDS